MKDLTQTVTSIDRMQVALLRFRRGTVIKTPLSFT
jgi:hypothetical protein